MQIKNHLPSKRTVEIATAVVLPVPYALYKGGEYAAKKVKEYRDRDDQDDLINTQGAPLATP